VLVGPLPKDGRRTLTPVGFHKAVLLPLSSNKYDGAVHVLHYMTQENYVFAVRIYPLSKTRWCVLSLNSSYTATVFKRRLKEGTPTACPTRLAGDGLCPY
jgi:hypothetical protein